MHILCQPQMMLLLEQVSLFLYLYFEIQYSIDLSFVDPFIFWSSISFFSKQVLEVSKNYANEAFYH